MRANPLRLGIDRNVPQIGTWINMVRNPAILTLYKAAGADFARLDVEHSSPSIETVANMAAMARALDFPLAVRPPEANREWITRLLDIGVWNLHCPQVRDAKHAAEIASASRYTPRGRRGNGGLGVGNDFDKTGTDVDRRKFANEQVFVTAMVETASALDELDGIAGTDGIDALTLGAADLAQDLGVRDTPDEASVMDEKRNEIFEAAKRHRKIFAVMVSTPEQARRWMNKGALLVIYSSDVDLLHEGLSNAMTLIKA
jgi:2-keto-3-deoxy-L-rhamnonate aldolase RhmA